MSEIFLIIELKMGYARETYGVLDVMLLSCILYIIAACQLTIMQEKVKVTEMQGKIFVSHFRKDHLKEYFSTDSIRGPNKLMPHP
jgi:hypothetical protein